MARNQRHGIAAVVLRREAPAAVSHQREHALRSPDEATRACGVGGRALDEPPRVCEFRGHERRHAGGRASGDHPRIHSQGAARRRQGLRIRPATEVPTSSKLTNSPRRDGMRVPNECSKEIGNTDKNKGKKEGNSCWIF